MQVFIETHKVNLGRREKQTIKSQTEALFSRVSGLIHSVKICLSDANGPKGGGIDKECTVIVKGRQPKSIVVKERQDTEARAIHRALNHANFNFLRNLKNKRMERSRIGAILAAGSERSEASGDHTESDTSKG